MYKTKCALVHKYPARDIMLSMTTMEQFQHKSEKLSI